MAKVKGRVTFNERSKAVNFVYRLPSGHRINGYKEINSGATLAYN